MSVVIRRLSCELIQDYFDFFEQRAFTDNSPCRCYCQVYQMSDEENRKIFNGVKESEVGRVAKAVAQRQIESGILQGYLAFDYNKAVGWCNCNDKANFPVLSSTGDSFYFPVAGKEKAVVCFEIAPEWRGRGIATALLQQAVNDAENDGYEVIDGFPEIREERYEWDSRGPVRLFEKCGFSKIVGNNGEIIMRRVFRKR